MPQWSVRIDDGPWPIALVVGALVAGNIFVTNRLWRSPFFETPQKIAQTVLLWLIPGGALVVELVHQTTLGRSGGAPFARGVNSALGEFDAEQGGGELGQGGEGHGGGHSGGGGDHGGGHGYGGGGEGGGGGHGGGDGAGGHGGGGGGGGGDGGHGGW